MLTEESHCVQAARPCTAHVHIGDIEQARHSLPRRGEEGIGLFNLSLKQVGIISAMTDDREAGAVTCVPSPS